MKVNISEIRKAVAATAAAAAVLVAAGVLSGAALNLANIVIVAAGSLGIGTTVWKVPNAGSASTPAAPIASVTNVTPPQPPATGQIPTP